MVRSGRLIPAATGVSLYGRQAGYDFVPSDFHSRRFNSRGRLQVGAPSHRWPDRHLNATNALVRYVEDQPGAVAPFDIHTEGAAACRPPDLRGEDIRVLVPPIVDGCLSPGHGSIRTGMFTPSPPVSTEI
jgi:hypothetical protein